MRSSFWTVPAVEFDQEQVSKGNMTPVFFGSALTNFGVETFLEHFLKMTTSPLPRISDEGEIDPMSDDFSAFVFQDPGKYEQGSSRQNRIYAYLLRKI